MKNIIKVLLLTVVATTFCQCTSAQKLQEKVPFKIGNVYYQHWVAGIQGGGSGVNIFIPIDNSDNTIQLDSVYFIGKVSKLESKPNTPDLFIGRFMSAANQKKDIIMSDEPNAEYGNELPEEIKKTPFELKPNECVISYVEDGKTKHFKITNITEKKAEFYPSAPPKKQ